MQNIKCAFQKNKTKEIAGLAFSPQSTRWRQLTYKTYFLLANDDAPPNAHARHCELTPHVK